MSQNTQPTLFIITMRRTLCSVEVVNKEITVPLLDWILLGRNKITERAKVIVLDQTKPLPKWKLAIYNKPNGKCIYCDNPAIGYDPGKIHIATDDIMCHTHKHIIQVKKRNKYRIAHGIPIDAPNQVRLKKSLRINNH